MPRRAAPVRRLRVIAGAVAGKGATESAFGGSRDADATGHLPPMGTVHAKRADGTWEENAEPDSVWDVKPGPSWTELQAGLAPLASQTWDPIDVDASEVERIFASDADPLGAVAEGRVPAVIIRGAFSSEKCKDIISMFIDRGLMRDPNVAADAADSHEVTADRAAGYGNGTDTRIDIGSSLVNWTRGALATHTPSTRGGTAADDIANREAFLEHSVSTNKLFADIFPEPDADPVKRFFDCMQDLATPVNKTVKVAYEPDGREYGPVIFRVHYESWAYAPHINHIRVGDKLFNFEASRFVHQFAGLICMANSEEAAEYDGNSPGATIYRHFPTPDIDEMQQLGKFHEFVEQEAVPHTTLDIQEGDFYLFNAGFVHEVPAVIGTDPRIVLATFIGYSQDDDEVLVWA